MRTKETKTNPLQRLPYRLTWAGMIVILPGFFFLTFLFSLIYFNFIHDFLLFARHRKSILNYYFFDQRKLYLMMMLMITMMMKAEELLLWVSFPGPFNHRSADVNHTHKNDSNNAPWNMFFLLPCMHKTFTDVNDTSPSYHLAKTTGVTSVYIYRLKIDTTITNQACAYAFFHITNMIWYQFRVQTQGQSRQ